MGMVGNVLVSVLSIVLLALVLGGGKEALVSGDGYSVYVVVFGIPAAVAALLTFFFEKRIPYSDFVIPALAVAAPVMMVYYALSSAFGGGVELVKVLQILAVSAAVVIPTALLYQYVSKKYGVPA